MSKPRLTYPLMRRCLCPECGWLMLEHEIESFNLPMHCPFCRKVPRDEFLIVPALDQGVRMFDDDTTEQHERRQVRCKAFGCNRRIIFLPTDNGNRMPVDADTVRPDDEEFDPARHVSHFASCPGASKFRRER